MKLNELESKYNHKYPEIFKQLWENDMLDWMNGRTEPFTSDENWAKSIYPNIKENPPLLLHTGGFEFELLRADAVLNFKFDELWDIETHKFVPFAKTDEGNIYAFYQNMKIENECAIVFVWNDINETEVLAKNFEDFIFRKMLEAVYDVDKDELSGDYNKEDFEGYRADILNDLKTITPYLKDEYVKILKDIYNREVHESLISYSLLSREELGSLIQKYLQFEQLDTIFEHEVD
ncbi:MAG: SMI1/KNR4 family protein [Sulfurovaceae bacterium]|nr:SMI1/KNR4 family protein [Sulfurovaceae bacterium]